MFNIKNIELYNGDELVDTFNDVIIRLIEYYNENDAKNDRITFN